MAEVEHGQIGIHFHGLIELLAKNLYPQEDMFLRELIQNAHDAILKRQGKEPNLLGRIDIRSDRVGMTLIIEDNGAGMTRQDIIDYLATIGRSGTGEFRQSLLESDRVRAQSLIGQFGIGLLSAYVAARQIVVETYSANEGIESLRWTTRGDADYTLETIERTQPGSTVTLHLKEGFGNMTDVDRLRQTVRKYADFLPFPIRVNGGEIVNTMHAPWHTGYRNEKEKRAAYFEWVDRRFPDIPLEVIPVELETPYEAKGVLFISDRRLPDVNTAGRLDIYQARMFIREGDRNLLPAWAKFIAGVIDSPALKPTAARDAIQENAAYNAIRDALGKLVLNALTEMSKREPERFQRLMDWHHYHIKGMAVQFDDFFDAIADITPFEINETERDGSTPMRMTLPEYIARQKQTDTEGRKILHYISEQGSAPQFYRLCREQGILALNASFLFEEEFLTKYIERHTDTLALRRVNIEDNEAIFSPLEDEERVRFADIEFRLKRMYNAIMPGQETDVRAERFKPAELPAVLTQTREREALSKLEEMVDHPGLQSSVLSAAIRQYMGHQEKRTPPIVLHLNADSPLIEQLRQEDFSDPLIHDAWLSIYNNAVLYSQFILTPHNQETLHGQTVKSLQNMLQIRSEQRQMRARIAMLEKEHAPETVSGPQRTDHVSLFVMMPFQAEYSAVLEQALRLVFEDDPYYFQIVLDRDKTRAQNLIDNVKANMREVHGFLAEISDHNPNVMLELGMTATDMESRPSFLLRHKDGAEVPADLRARLYINYELPPPGTADAAQQVAKELREKFATHQVIENFQQRRVCRYLSAVHLRRRLDGLTLSDKEAKDICHAFGTLEMLEQADAESIQGRAGIARFKAAAIAAEFRKV